VAFLHATERHNYREGCPEEDCHRSIQIHPIRVPSVKPDHPTAISWQDFARGHDPLLEKATELLVSGSE